MALGVLFCFAKPKLSYSSFPILFLTVEKNYPKYLCAILRNSDSTHMYVVALSVTIQS
jgi:hypothetical protein